MELLIFTWTGQRTLCMSGPGPRLIPWLLPDWQRQPAQKQSKELSLSASFPSYENSHYSTILSYRRCNWRARLLQIYSLLFPFFSPTITGPIFSQPTDIKQTNIQLRLPFSHKPGRASINRTVFNDIFTSLFINKSSVSLYVQKHC